MRRLRDASHGSVAGGGVGHSWRRVVGGGWVGGARAPHRLPEFARRRRCPGSGGNAENHAHAADPEQGRRSSSSSDSARAQSSDSSARARRAAGEERARRRRGACSMSMLSGRTTCKSIGAIVHHLHGGASAAGGGCCELPVLLSKPCPSTACWAASCWASAARGCRGRRPHRRTARGGGRGRARQEGLGAREPRWRRRAWVSQRLARCTPSKFLGQPGIGIWLIGINSGYARSPATSPWR